MADPPTPEKAPSGESSSLVSDRTHSAPKGTPSSGPRPPRAFTPGVLLAQRYRIVAPLGRGGMGEIYRAEDTKLGQTVALKFMREVLSREALERLYAEVRIGRQISHPNVCRLYDVAEYEGETFLTMEYVDGEDLSSLLSRIGRLPSDKAKDLARDLCAGLAAVHDKGVVHRDLKPANVMDGRGRARLTDFGLALAEGGLREEGVAGTPAYMAPEQFEGKEPTAQGDLYALGLILFEMFTGRRFYDGRTLREIREQRREPRAQRLASSSGGLRMEPPIERLVLDCLEEHPEARPVSARAVLVRLPGGDPLEAAVAAGETPSPELVAAAARTGDLPPLAAWGLLLATVLGLGLNALIFDRTGLIRASTLPHTPEWLAEHAADALARLNHGDRADSAGFLEHDRAFFDYVRQDRSAGALRRLREAPFTPFFSYYQRQSPRKLVPANRDAMVQRDDPARTVAGMADVVLDARGRLTSFSLVPPQMEEPAETAWPEPDWSPLFREAGIDPANLAPATPEWASPVDSDRKAAWTGVYPDRADWPIRVEAAAYHGRPVFFRVLLPWARPERLESRRFDKSLPVSTLFLPLLALALPVGGALLARRNLRLGRGDRKGAFRVAAFVFASYAIARFLRADHVADARDEVWTLIKVFAYPALWALQLWVVYVALEPYARRRWPHMLISWKRLLSGGFGDPLVGRDILLGCLAGVAAALTYFVNIYPPEWLGSPAIVPEPLASGETLSALRFVGFRLFVNQFSAVLFALAYLLMIVLFRVVLRNTALAMAAFCVIQAWPQLGQDPILEWVTGLARALLLLATLVRGGLLAATVALYVGFCLLEVPPTLDLSGWYAMRCLPVVLMVLGLATWGFQRSLGGKPLFGSGLLED